MTTIVLDIAAFRAMFPAYADATTYPDGTITVWWSAASNFISDEYCPGWSNFMTLKQQTLALSLMTAMWGDLTAQIVAGDATGIITSATIDKISVQVAEPPVKNQWQYWLTSSPYGQQLLALLQLAGVGGKYYPGRRGGIPMRRM